MAPDTKLGFGPGPPHYNHVIMGAMASQITNLAIVYSTVYSSSDQRKHQSSSSLAFVWGIHRWFPDKGPVTRKMMTSSWISPPPPPPPPNTFSLGNTMSAWNFEKRSIFSLYPPIFIWVFIWTQRSTVRLFALLYINEPYAYIRRNENYDVHKLSFL